MNRESDRTGRKRHTIVWADGEETTVWATANESEFYLANGATAVAVEEGGSWA